MISFTGSVKCKLKVIVCYLFYFLAKRGVVFEMVGSNVHLQLVYYVVT